MATLTVTEQIPGSDSIDYRDVIIPERLTVRQLICHYVQQQVERQQQVKSEPSNSFFIPKTVKQATPGSKPTIEQLQERALTAFTDNQIVVLLNDRQAEELDENIEITGKSNVTFLRLTPLIGG